MNEDLGFALPSNYFANFPISKNVKLRTLLKTKDIVLKCEEMIKDWLMSFHVVRTFNTMTLKPLRLRHTIHTPRVNSRLHVTPCKYV